MFKAVINDTKSWKSSIDAIASLIDEGTLQIEKEGLKLRAMDPSQIALVDFELPAKGFESYKVDNPTSIGVDFAELSKITKRARAEDKIELSLEESRLKINFRSGTTRSFSIGILESSSTPPREPKIEFTAEVKLGSNTIKEALKDAELVSNHVALKAGEGFSIKADGDTGSVDINFEKDQILGINVKKEVKEARSVFSLEYLNNILSAADATSIVIIKLKTDSPLRAEYAIGEGRVVYYLAPRIENV